MIEATSGCGLNQQSLATGPTGQFFNYSDGSAKRSVEPILLWFANRCARPEWLSGEHARWQQFFGETKENNSESLRFLPLALLWPAREEENPTGKLPLNWSSGASVPVVILRSSWQDKNATYVGVKGGSPSASHGHMDSGSFVLESDGIRWAIDLEPENYHTIESRCMNLWDRGQNSDRWKLLRLNNHGHNTLVINNQLQNSSGNAPIIAFSDKPDWPFTIVDLTDAYRGQVKSARRGVALLPSGQVIIRDELTGLKAGVMVRWGMVTRGEPVGLGTDRIVLNQENQTLALAATSTHRVAWQKIDISTPKNDFDSPNPGACLIALQATAPSTGLLTIVVQATPGTSSTPNIDSSSAAPLLDWPPHHD